MVPLKRKTDDETVDNSLWEGGRPERRQEIMTKAVQLIQEKGFRQMTLDELAEQLDFTKAAFYYYLSSKKDLLYLIHDHSMTTLMTTMEQILSKPMDPEEKLRQCIRAYVIMIADNLAGFQIYFIEKRELRVSDQETLTGREREFVKSLTRIYEEGVHQGRFINRNSAVVIHSILGMCAWMTRWYHETGSCTPAEVATIITDIVFRGLVPRDNTIDS